MSDQPADRQLTADSAVAALREICKGLSLDAEGTELLGPVGDNAVFRLPAHRLVARLTLAGRLQRLRREVSIAHWLAALEFPAVRVAGDVDELVVHDGLAASFWEWIPDLAQSSAAEIGELLQQLHQLPPPPAGLLAPHDPFAGQREHIEAADVSEDDRAFLRARLSELEDAYPHLPYNWPLGVVHGDAHRKNVVRAGDGRLLLLDLERFGLGHREWDIVVPAVYHRVGWYSRDEYDAFTQAYGYDITEWDGFATLVAIRELRMTTWLAARTGREPRLLPEARKRIASLRDDTAPRDWTPGE
ncbi:aminoglycoside phosphotransferase/kinase family protein [Flindersiella endophytica]